MNLRSMIMSGGQLHLAWYTKGGYIIKEILMIIREG